MLNGNMKLLNNYIDIIDKKSIIESRYTIKQVPLCCNCTNDRIENDINEDMIFGISKETGIIQIVEYPDNNYIYCNGAHNKAIGKIWEGLFIEICKTVNQYCTGKINNICEIGGGSGKLLNILNKNLQIRQYILYEPNIDNLEVYNYKNVNIIQKYFDNDTTIDDVNLIIHSHLLEHVDNQFEFLQNISKNMLDKTLHIFAIPNMHKQFEKKYSNVLFWKHKNFITEYFVDHLLNKSNIEIIEKKYYLDHSIIYITKKSPTLKKTNLVNQYDIHDKLLNCYFEFYPKLINYFNSQLLGKKFYIFGAHIFTQILICFGLNVKNACFILDNDVSKVGKRLYGTTLHVKNPTFIKDEESPIVLLNASSYQEEIKTQLLNINKTTVIIEKKGFV